MIPSNKFTKIKFIVIQKVMSKAKRGQKSESLISFNSKTPKTPCESKSPYMVVTPYILYSFPSKKLSPY